MQFRFIEAGRSTRIVGYGGPGDDVFVGGGGEDKFYGGEGYPDAKIEYSVDVVGTRNVAPLEWAAAR